MKTAIYCLGAVSLATIAVAQPSHRFRHEHLHHKRDAVTQVDYVTAAEPDVVVYVNEAGDVLYTSYVSQTPATATTAAVSSAVTSVSVAATTATTVAAVSTKVASSPAAVSTSAVKSTSAAASTSASSSAAASSSSGSASNSGYGVSYSPYSGVYQDNDVGCKTTAEVATDFDSISDYSLVRIYGTDCNQVANVLAAAKPKSMKIFAGVYDITQVEAELDIIIAAADGDWSNFHTISIGNELVNDGTATVAAVTSAITQARSILAAASYTGKIVTVDTFVAVKANPALCEASDYAAVNAHPFFDGSVTAENAGAWVLMEQQEVSAACGGMTTWITETGWPSAGEDNGVAVPSTANQASAISSIKGSVSSNIVLFTAFNDMWKAPGYLEVEQSWGFIN